MPRRAADSRAVRTPHPGPDATLRTGPTMPSTRFDWVAHARALVSLAWPIMLAQGVLIAIANVDLIMVGRASTAELAYLGVGRQVYWLAAIMGFACMAGIQVFVARADGLGDRRAARAAWAQGLLYAAALGLGLGAVAAVAGPAALGAMGLGAALVREGSHYIWVTALGLPVVFLSTAAMLTYEGISRPRPGMALVVSTIPLNIALNWLLIDGRWGLPAMGATGAGWATNLSYLVAAVAQIAVLVRAPGFRRYGFRLRAVAGRRWRRLWRDGRGLRRFGLAPGLAAGVEMASFALLSFYAARLGERPVAAFQVLLGLHAILFLVAMGLAGAVSVRVGNAVGRRDWAAIGPITGLGAGLTVIVMGLLSLGLWLAPETLAGLFNDEPATRALAAEMVRALAPAIAFDGLQFVLVFALRAAGDQKMAAVLQILSMWLGMAVGGAVATFALGWGPMGPVAGFAAGVVLAALFLGMRFAVMARRWAGRASADAAPTPGDPGRVDRGRAPL
ncbi:hypothetical protein CCR85_00200 [Rhodothalassium salexigens]|nr:hypothetical protein [Rhodothalassium salexigens]